MENGSESSIGPHAAMAAAPGQPCVGPTQQTGPCDEPIQDIDCELSEWQATAHANQSVGHRPWWLVKVVDPI